MVVIFSKAILAKIDYARCEIARWEILYVRFETLNGRRGRYLR